jgi:hypothetical protein
MGAVGERGKRKAGQNLRNWRTFPFRSSRARWFRAHCGAGGEPKRRMGPYVPWFAGASQ